MTYRLAISPHAYRQLLQLPGGASGGAARRLQRKLTELAAYAAAREWAEWGSSGGVESFEVEVPGPGALVARYSLDHRDRVLTLESLESSPP